MDCLNIINSQRTSIVLKYWGPHAIRSGWGRFQGETPAPLPPEVSPSNHLFPTKTVEFPSSYM